MKRYKYIKYKEYMKSIYKILEKRETIKISTLCKKCI